MQKYLSSKRGKQDMIDEILIFISSGIEDG